MDSNLSSKITLNLLYHDTKKVYSQVQNQSGLEALKERQTVKDLAQRYEILPQQINLWKREFLSQAESVFEKGEKSGKSEAEEKEDRLLKVIGQQKVELDFLKKALR